VAVSLPDQIKAAWKSLSPIEKIIADWQIGWINKRLDHQVPPPGDWWTIWLLMAGRGAGKTRTAAETLGSWAALQPRSRWLVSAPTYSDLTGVCFEGESGLVNCIPPQLVKAYNRSDVEMELYNGALIKGITAEKPERFRGPQFHGGWCLPADTMIGDKRIDQIKVGDFVPTRFGLRRVLAAGKSRNTNDVVTIECGDTRLTATIDHPILIGDRWVPAGDVRPGDLLWFSTRASHGTPGPQVTCTTSAEDTFTDTCGNNSTGQSRTDTLSTTKTTTLPTMLRRIWNSCRNLSISDITESDRKTAKPNAFSPLKRLRNFVCPRSEHALNAGVGSSQKLSEASADFVLASAGKSGVETNLSLKSALVSFAEISTSPRSGSRDIAAKSATTNQRSEPIELKKLAVQSVVRSPNIPTYNLTVEGEHEFIANGIVVHNCDELAAWQRAEVGFDLLMFGMRLGARPRLICSTTPKPNTITRNLLAREGKDVSVTRASTYANLPNLAPTFRDQILRYEGTTIGRQEIHAEVINPEEMGVIKRSWLKMWPHDRPLPELEFVVMSMDTAFTEETGSGSDPDYSACAVWGVFSVNRDRRDVILLDCWQERLGFPDLIKRVKVELKAVYAPRERAIIKPLIGASYMEDSGRKPDILLIEDKGSGISLRQTLSREGIISAPYNPGRARKLDRLHAISPLFAAGRVWVTESAKVPGQFVSWAQPMIEQLCTFSGEGSIPHDDMMDAAVQGLRYIADRDMIRVTRPEAPEPRVVDDRPKENPYAA
jgi:predicted phage terminase large subunit-like protein